MIPDAAALRQLLRHRTDRGSSGEQRQHRLSRAGNRRLNRALRLVAVCQIRTSSPGREFYQRKLAEAKTPAEARRALKRRLSDTIYRHLTRDRQAEQLIT